MLLANNYRVAATSSTKKSCIEAVEENENFLPIEIDITSNNGVAKAITVSHFGQFDVVVNTAGYNQIGTLDDLSDEEVKRILMSMSLARLMLSKTEKNT